VWRVKDSNLGRRTPTDLQSASFGGLTSKDVSSGLIGAWIGRAVGSCEAERSADLLACGQSLTGDALGVDP
jgi:hypothetical protein